MTGPSASEVNAALLVKDWRPPVGMMLMCVEMMQLRAWALSVYMSGSCTEEPPSLQDSCAVLQLAPK